MKTLERRLGLGSVIAISIAAMLGSGLFVLPGIAVGYTGPSVWLAYLAAGLCVLPAALSKAELATAMPESGGTYVYIDRTFGPLAGTIAGLFAGSAENELSTWRRIKSRICSTSSQSVLVPLQ